MADQPGGKTRFILASGVKWGLSVWLIFMISAVLGELDFGNMSSSSPAILMFLHAEGVKEQKVLRGG